MFNKSVFFLNYLFELCYHELCRLYQQCSLLKLPEIIISCILNKIINDKKVDLKENGDTHCTTKKHFLRIYFINSSICIWSSSTFLPLACPSVTIWMYIVLLYLYSCTHAHFLWNDNVRHSKSHQLYIRLKVASRRCGVRKRSITLGDLSSEPFTWKKTVRYTLIYYTVYVHLILAKLAHK